MNNMQCPNKRSLYSGQDWHLVQPSEDFNPSLSREYGHPMMSYESWVKVTPDRTKYADFGPKIMQHLPHNNAEEISERLKLHCSAMSADFILRNITTTRSRKRSRHGTHSVLYFLRMHETPANLFNQDGTTLDGRSGDIRT